jgi:hypothetical protein
VCQNSEQCKKCLTLTKHTNGAKKLCVKQIPFGGNKSLRKSYNTCRIRVRIKPMVCGIGDGDSWYLNKYAG